MSIIDRSIGSINKLFALYSVSSWLIFDPSSILYEKYQNRDKIIQRIAVNKLKLINLLEKHCETLKETPKHKQYRIGLFEPFEKPKTKSKSKSSHHNPKNQIQKPKKHKKAKGHVFQGIGECVENSTFLRMLVPITSKIQYLVWFFLVLNFHLKTRYKFLKYVVLISNILYCVLALSGISCLFISSFQRGSFFSFSF